MGTETPEKVSKDGILAERLVEAVRHIVAMSVPAMLQETGAAELVSAAETLLASTPHQYQPTQRQQRQRGRFGYFKDARSTSRPSVASSARLISIFFSGRIKPSLCL